MKFGESLLLSGLISETAATHWLNQVKSENRAVRNNIYGDPLAKCDRSLANDPNWPRTGYMREDYCTASSIDRGSHYVCVNLPEGQTDAGDRYSPFWTITGQADHPEEATTWPLPGPWCICEWAFASMLERHGKGFEDMLFCAAINQWVIESYSLNVPKQLAALQSICSKCDVIEKATLPHLAEKCQSAMDKL